MKSYILGLLAISLLCAWTWGNPISNPGGGVGSGDFLADGTVPMTADLNLDGFNLSNAGTMFLKEQAEADADVAGSGQIWVNTAIPNELYFTNDAGTDNEVILSAGTQTITGDKTFSGNLTIGAIKIQTPVSGSTTEFAAGFTGSNLYGGTYVVTSDDGDLQLPLMVAGMSFAIITSGAIQVVAATNANDGYMLDGVSTAEDNSVVNTSTTGDIAVFQYYTADDWLITTNGWTTE